VNQCTSHNIPTFPVQFLAGRKKPAVRGYLSLGLPYSTQLALKFPANDAFGFGLRRAKIAVLDVDSTDERVRDDAFARHGEPAIVVRTISGNFQGWYRHDGEPRKVKPWPDRPIDILGHGYVCAPPSRGPAGRYEFIQGGLDDLDRLSTLRNLELPLPLRLARQRRPVERIPEGVRNDRLWEYCMRIARICDSLTEVEDAARAFATEAIDLHGKTHRFTEAEIQTCARSAWRYETEGTNMFGRYRAAVLGHCEIDACERHPDALALYLSRTPS
jgi:hypothetical protein